MGDGEILTCMCVLCMHVRRRRIVWCMREQDGESIQERVVREGWCE